MIYLKNSIRNIFCLVLAQSEGRAIFKNALFSKVIVKYKIFFEFIRVSTILIFLVCSIIFAYFSKPKPPCFLVPCPRSVPLLILNMLRYTLIDTFKIMSFHFEKKMNVCGIQVWSAHSLKHQQRGRLLGARALTRATP